MRQPSQLYLQEATAAAPAAQHPPLHVPRICLLMHLERL